MSKELNLLDCPFCGEAAMVWDNGFVSCSGNCACGAETDFFCTKENWNTRATPKHTREELVEVVADAIRFRPVIWQHQVEHTAEIALAALEAIGAVKVGA